LEQGHIETCPILLGKSLPALMGPSHSFSSFCYDLFNVIETPLRKLPLPPSGRGGVPVGSVDCNLSFVREKLHNDDRAGES